MTSSDEAVVTAFWRAVEYARHAYDLAYSKMSEDAWPNAVRAAWPIIAAAVRAEAVADAERAIREAAASVLPPDGLTERFDLAAHSAFTLAVSAVHELAAAAHLGGVRADNAVLDIPAQRRTPERAPITPRTPSQPVTCEHGQSASHYTTVISGLCPGPVSVPARCQGFTIRERPDHQPLGPCIHCGNIYQQH